MKKQRKKLLLILAIVIAWTLGSYYLRTRPQTVYTYDEYSYTIEEGDTIKLIGYTGTESELIIPTHIDQMPVTCIGGDIFRNNGTIKSLTLNHEYIDLGVFSFYRAEKLETIHIGKNVRSINGIWNLDSKKLNKTTVDRENISYMSRAGILYSINNNILLKYPRNYINSIFVVPDSVTEIFDSAFYGSENLTEIVLPPNMKEIGSDAFRSCGNLRKLNIPDGITTIKDGTFNFCKSLDKIDIPDSVTKISFSAFYMCSSLKQLRISKYVLEFIGAHRNGWSFAVLCDSLETIDVDPDNPHYSSIEGVLYDKAQQTLFRYPPAKKEETILIPTTVRIIHPNAFKGTFYLKKLDLPSSVKIVEKYAFSDNSSLEYIKFNQGLEQVDSNAFYKCISLKEVDLPASLRRIGDTAFQECEELKKVIFRGKTLEICGQELFYLALKVTIYGPKDSWVERLAVKEYLPFIALDE